MGHGARPQPSALKIARGNPGKRPLNHQEPKPPPVLPDPPEHLNDTAKEVWKTEGPILRDCGILARSDISTFERWCSLRAQWISCCEFLQMYGWDEIVRDEHGDLISVREYPQAKRALNLSNALLRCEIEMGMTPAARSKIKAIPVQEDELEQLLKIPA